MLARDYLPKSLFCCGEGFNADNDTCTQGTKEMAKRPFSLPPSAKVIVDRVTGSTKNSNVARTIGLSVGLSVGLPLLLSTSVALFLYWREREERKRLENIQAEIMLERRRRQ
jgi:hypothetical protein